MLIPLRFYGFKLRFHSSRMSLFGRVATGWRISEVSPRRNLETNHFSIDRNNTHMQMRATFCDYNGNV